jgi:hypothetical protein
MPADHIAHGVRSFKMKREYPVLLHTEKAALF